jgi:hypothetical protein
VAKGSGEPTAAAYLAAAVARANSVNNKLFVAVAALVLIWATSLERQHIESKSILREQRRVEFLRDVNGSLRENYPFEWKTAGASAQITPRQRDTWQRRKAEFTETLSRLTPRTETPDVTFDVFGLKFAARPHLAGLFWLFLLIGAGAYLLAQRRTCLALLAKSVYSAGEMRSEPDPGEVGPPTPRLPRAPGMPFWLAPLPRRSGHRGIRAEDIASVLGWGRDGHRWRVLIAAGFTLGFLAITARVAWIGSVTVARMEASWLVVAAIAVAFAAASLLVLEWWWPSAVDDSPREDAFPAAPRRLHLIALLAVAAVGVAASRGVPASLASTLKPPFPKHVRTRQRKRRRTQALPINLPGGFYVNSRTGVAYYVTAEGLLLSLSTAPSRNHLRPIKVQELGSRVLEDNERAVWVARRVASISYETAAIDALARSDNALARAILLVGVRQSIATGTDVGRLPELYATLVARGRGGAFENVTRLAPRGPLGEVFGERARSWGDMQSGWRRRRARESYRWSGLPM